MSDRCTKHPDRPAVVQCQKMDLGYCEECLDTCQACTEPTGYCKYRTGCVTWEMCRQSDRVRRLRDEGAGRG
jgi:hypothetical protein